MQVWWALVLSAQQGGPEELGQPRPLDRGGPFSRAQAGASAQFAVSACLQQHWQEKLWERLCRLIFLLCHSSPLLRLWWNGWPDCSLQHHGSQGHLFNALHVLLVYSVQSCSNCPWLLKLYALFVCIIHGRRKKKRECVRSLLLEKTLTASHIHSAYLMPDEWVMLPEGHCSCNNSN